ncbi:MAG: hypothetical protein JO263_10740 [Candidatus Eremiobacteraeota bacterium]|nr:hypothetical protein [Candidatus Eremiobacteraeota bacterium]
MTRALPLLALSALLCSPGCSSNTATATAPPVQGTTSTLRTNARAGMGHLTSQYISHVIVIIQENRSFENFFAGYPGANAPMTGCANVPHPGRTATRNSGSGCPTGDTVVPLHEITFKGPDIEHDWHSSMISWNNGNMDGFWQFGEHRGAYSAYAYVKRAAIRPYWEMAQQYVLADAMYPTEFGGSFTGHLTLVAGTDNLTYKPQTAEVDFPSAPPDDCDAPPGTKSSYITKDRHKHSYRGPFPCFDQWRTIAEVLDTAQVSWKYYATALLNAGMWEPFEAMKYVRYGPDWNRNIIVPQTTVLTDPGNNQLASVSFVTPSKQDSDHPAQGSGGPSWVADVVNAIGESSYWDSSAIIVVWDDWGGWYDNAPPPQLDLRGLGIRVPCLIVSPYAKQGYVAHGPYEFGSILRFIEETFNLPNIGPVSKGYTDGRAASLDDAFDFTQQPRKFVPITRRLGPEYFLHEPPSHEPVDTE